MADGTGATVAIVVFGDERAAAEVVGRQARDGVTIIAAPRADGDVLAAHVTDPMARLDTEFVMFLGQGDRLTDGAVALLAGAATPGIDIVYGDERIDGEIFAKPDHSPERLRSHDLLGPATIYRRTLLERIGGLRPGVEGAELYDLALRASRAAEGVAHVREVVSSREGGYSAAREWAGDDRVVLESIRAVLEDHLSATGGGRVEAVDLDGFHRTSRIVDGSPLVSIVIPTRGTSAMVRGVERCMVVEAVRSVVERSSYTNVEFVIVIDDVAEEWVYDELRAIAGDAVRFVLWTRPFSFSDKMNLGVVHARGEFVLLLNDDVEVISEDWIEALLSLGQLPGAGIVGGMLYFDDDSIQHAGHAYRRLDVTHIGLHSDRGAAGPFDGFRVEREVAGNTGACALMTRSLFLEAGGFSSLLPGNFNDVDLCMKVARLGYQSYWTPRAELYHFESKSRDPRVAASEIRIAWGRWEDGFWDSPYWPTDPHIVYHRETS